MMAGRRRVLAAAFAAAILWSAPAGVLAQRLPVSELVIVTADGQRHRWSVELANDDASRTRGLMHRRSLPADAGMLFDYGLETPVGMWMRNTLIPLDMLFITADGRILNIHRRAIPHDEAVIQSAGPVRAVLELNAGAADRFGIKPGDRVEHPIFSLAARPPP